MSRWSYVIFPASAHSGAPPRLGTLNPDPNQRLAWLVRQLRVVPGIYTHTSMYMDFRFAGHDGFTAAGERITPSDASMEMQKVSTISL